MEGTPGLCQHAAGRCIDHVWPTLSHHRRINTHSAWDENSMCWCMRNHEASVIPRSESCLTTTKSGSVDLGSAMRGTAVIVDVMRIVLSTYEMLLGVSYDLALIHLQPFHTHFVLSTYRVHHGGQ